MLSEDHEIQSDGITVWVHQGGATIGRFGRYGIDIHTADGAACLDCTHGVVGLSDWLHFKEGMLLHYGIEVGDEHRPTRLTPVE